MFWLISLKAPQIQRTFYCFNTSYVLVDLSCCFRLCDKGNFVSIHPMFWLIPVLHTDGNGSGYVSIHPMFWLILDRLTSVLSLKSFQYILCSGWSRLASRIFLQIPVSIHPMFWLIFALKCLAKCLSQEVSIHPMFWLIRSGARSPYLAKKVSIHPMFWLIYLIQPPFHARLFVSIHPMFWLIVSHTYTAHPPQAGSFNTSYVLVDHFQMMSFMTNVSCFNTSYVLVDLKDNVHRKFVSLFQYILCSGWSNVLKYLLRYKDKFQYILCSGWSCLCRKYRSQSLAVSIHPMFWLILNFGFKYLAPVLFQYILCSGWSRTTNQRQASSFCFNTSYVLVDLYPADMRIVSFCLCFNTSYVLVDLHFRGRSFYFRKCFNTSYVLVDRHER